MVTGGGGGAVPDIVTSMLSISMVHAGGFPPPPALFWNIICHKAVVGLNPESVWKTDVSPKFSVKCMLVVAKVRSLP